MSDFDIVPWPEMGLYALLFRGRFVTAGSRQYCELVQSSAPAEAVETAARGKEWDGI